MKRRPLSPTCAALALLILSSVGRAAIPTPEQLLPANTTELVVISDLNRLEQTWTQTQLARLLADPAMKPFLDEVWPTTKNHNYLVETMGASWSTIKAAAGGDMGWGLALLNDKEVAHILTLDMVGRPEGARALYKEVGDKLQAQGAKFDQRTYEGMSLIVAELPQNRLILYGVKDTILVATDHWAALQGVMARFNGRANDSLANQLAHQKVRQRSQPLPGESPLLRWYYEPVARVEAQMIFQPELKKVKGDNLAQCLRKEGVDAIKGVGGTVAFVSNGTDMLARGAAYAPPPFRGAMRMARLPNETLATPEPWVPADLSAWVTVSLDLVNALDTFDTLFERLADEDPGTYKEILDSLKNDPDGPRVDIRKEIFEQLTNRVTLVNDATVPAHEKSERFVIGIPAKDAEAAKIVAKALVKCFEPDKRMSKRVFQGALIWEYTPRQAIAKSRRGTDQAMNVPTIAFSVARGSLFISTHGGLLEKILSNTNRHNLAEASDFQRLMAEMVRLGMGPSSSRFFGRVDLGARTTYEMLRANRLAGVESVYAHILLQMVKLDDEGKRLRVDGSKLPPYSVVTPYLSLIGSYSTTFDDGWSATAVSLKK